MGAEVFLAAAAFFGAAVLVLVAVFFGAASVVVFLGRPGDLAPAAFYTKMNLAPMPSNTGLPISTYLGSSGLLLCDRLCSRSLLGELDGSR